MQATTKTQEEPSDTVPRACESEDDLHTALQALQIQKAELELLNHELESALITVREGRDELEAVMLTALDGFWITDLEGRFLKVNETYCRLVGYSEAELLTLGLADLEGGARPEEVRARCRRVAREGRERFETRHRRKDGALLDFELSVRYVPRQGGRIFCFARDITERKESEAALAQSDRRFRLLFDAAPIGIGLADLNGNLLKFNQSLLKLTGYTEAELRNRNLSEVYADREERFRVLEEVLDSGRVRDCEVRLKRRDLSECLALLNIDLTDLEGEPVLLTCLQDITERKETERELDELYRTLEKRIELRTRQLSVANALLEQEVAEHQRLEEALRVANLYNRSLIETNPDPLVTIGPDGKITDVNSSTEEATGYRREELVGTDFSDFFTDSDRARAGYQKVFRDGFVRDYELRLRHRSGTSIPIVYNASVYRDSAGQVIGMVAAARDISRLKQVEAELRTHRGQLENLVLQRTAQLMAACEEAEAANKAKSAFLANISHEIRTPINGIVGMTDLLRSCELDPEQLEYLDGIVFSAGNLMGIINDVIDLAKVEAGKMEIERVRFPIRETVQEVFRVQRLLIEKKGLWTRIEIDPRLPALVVGDPLRVKQVLLNLVGNAAKFTDTGGITLSVEPRETEGHRLVAYVSVSDTGVGIEPEPLSKLFRPFSQADSSTTRKYGGSGLGLAICKNLVELMGGEIGCLSTKGKGSTFFFLLPLDLADELPRVDRAPAAPVVASPASSASLSLLLVDDNEMNRLVTSRLLHRAGHRVECAADGAEALRMWGGKGYDVIIMDVQMPGMDGIEATRIIREREVGGVRTPIVALTANALTGDRERLLLSGFDGYASKPTTIDALVAELTRVAAGR